MPKTMHKPSVPTGWSRVELGAVLDERTSKVTPSGGDARPYIALEHMESCQLTLLGHDRADSATSNKTEFSAGDILFGKLRPKLRKCVLAPFDGVCSTDILALFPQNGTDPRFLSQLCHTHQVMGYAIRTASGTKMPRTSWDMLSMCPILLPPPAEQAKIAAVLGAVDEAVERSRAVLAQTKTLRHALLHTLLTRGLPGKHTKFTTDHSGGRIPAAWSMSKLRDVLREPIRNGFSPVCPAQPTGKWVLSLSAVTPSGYNPEGVKPVSLDNDRVDDAMLVVGDIVVSRSNTAELVGLAGMYDGTPANCAYSDLLMRVRVDEARVRRAFAMLILLSPGSRRYFARTGRGTSGSMKKIDRTILEDLPFPAPPIEEQDEILAIAARADTRLAAAAAHLSQMERVKSALSAALLSGEVRVPVDCLSAVAAAPTKGEVGHG